MGGGASIPVGQRVLVNNRHDATVRYVGKVDHAQGMWYGVELKKPLGTGNGTWHGRTYFECTANHGMLVRNSQVSPYTDEAKAATTIEGAMRKHLAKKEVARRQELKMYNALDNHEEQLNLERRAKLGAALRAPEEAPSSDIGDAEIDKIEVASNYDGPVLTWPLTLECVTDMLAAFKNGKVLHAKYMLQLLAQFTKVARELPTVVRITIKEGCRFTIVGDTHGQLKDILHIFDINGIPSPINAYLINGDFVDRGDKGVEIACLIMAFQLLYPETMFINRGNHECRSQTQVQGFMMEVLDKYNPPTSMNKSSARAGGQKARGNQVYEYFMKAFDALPLASVVQGNVFVVHGGLFERRGVRLSHLEAINRFREIPLSRGTFEDGLFQDMMWSDPQDERGVRPSSRGAGQFFGKDVTQAFCRSNNLHLVIRSHECVPDGFEFTHSSQLLTLFSASDYCGDTGNMGAFVVFKDDMKANIEQFMATAAEADKGPSRLARTHKAVIAKLIDLICASKHDLFWFFSNMDRMRTGTVSRVEWADALKTVLKLDLPFMRLCNDLSTVEADGRINYRKFLDRYSVELPGVGEHWHESMVERVYEKLVVACSDVKAAYKMFDVNEDGKVEYKEFVEALKRLDLGLTDAMLYDLMGFLDTDSNAHIDFAEFAQRFQVVIDKEHQAADAAEKKWHDECMTKLGAVLFRMKTGQAITEFTKADSAGSGSLPYAAWADTMLRLADIAKFKLSLSKDDLLRVAAAIDKEHVGSVQYKSFVKSLKVNDSMSGRKMSGSTVSGGGAGAGAGAGLGDGAGNAGKRVPTAELRGTSWDQARMQDLVTTLYEYRVELAASFRLFDIDNSGHVSPQEFKRGLEALKLPFNQPITDAHIAELMRVLDKDGDGQLNYDEFLNGFSILNTETGQRSKQNYRHRA